MCSDKSLEGFSKTDKSYRESSVFENFFDRIIGRELVRVYPDALTHEERIVSHALLSLDLKAVHELVDREIHHSVERLKECADIVVCLYSESREIYRCEAEISSACYYLTGRIVVVAYNSCTAAHIRDLGVGIAGLIVL